MKLRVVSNNKIHRNRTYIIMYRHPAPNAAVSRPIGRVEEDYNNGNSVGELSRAAMTVPSVITSLDAPADVNSNMSVSSSSDTEESSSYIHDGMGNVETVDALTAEAIRAVKSGKTRQRIRLEDLPPEEAQRRSVRRVRNKEAAAKCRQRRVDQTNVLVDETGTLEQVKSDIEQEIAALMQEKEQLEFILHTHKPVCTMRPKAGGGRGRGVSVQDVTVKSEPLSPGPSRPSTLPITSMSMGLRMPSTSTCEAATGIPITTPSGDGLFSFTVDTPMLTPTCVTTGGQRGKPAMGGPATGLSLDTPSSLNTPSSPTFLSL